MAGRGLPAALPAWRRPLSGGKTLRDLARGIVDALNFANDNSTRPELVEGQLREATKPFASPALREQLLKMKKKADLAIDTVTQDTLLHAGFSAGNDRATVLVQSRAGTVQVDRFRPVHPSLRATLIAGYTSGRCHGVPRTA